MTTPFQPTLPNEVPFTEAEISFIDDSPPGLYPENQNSNYGLLRKANTDQIQRLIDQLELIYNERFVRTSSTFIDVWEKEMGLPVNPQGKSLDQRRVAVLGRIAKGPFTRTRRARTVEGFIVATFGGPIQIFPEGVALSPAGTPLYAEFADVKTLYEIRENVPISKNLFASGNFETAITDTYGSNVTISLDTAQAKFGTNSLKNVVTSTGATPYSYTNVPVSGQTQGRAFTGSLYVKGVGSTVGKQLVFYMSEMGGASPQRGTLGVVMTLTANWQRISSSIILQANDRTHVQLLWYVNTPVVAVNDTFYVDGVQVENAQNPSGKNKFVWGNFEYHGLEAWGVSGATVAASDFPHDGWRSMLVSFPPGSYIASVVGLDPGGTAGQTYTLSGWFFGGGAEGKVAYIQVNEAGGTAPEVGISGAYVTLTNGWQRVSCTGTVTANDRTRLVIYISNVSGGSWNFIMDSVQVELGDTATPYADPVVVTPFVDPQQTPYYYEVRIKNSVTPDMVALNRELLRITPAGITFDVRLVPDI